MPLRAGGNIYAQAMRKGGDRAEALRKRRIEKELVQQLGYSRSQAKKIVSELDGAK
ncbi:hypothetical protein C8R31_101120 [Nitrosospira sp. Nsp2]|nr:hypothetical protein C8R31_101120 [Nitrosospira sp. Nsp2]